MTGEGERVLRILRRALDGGQTVEIDGLGVFRASGGRYRFIAETRPRVFVAYVEEDLALARRVRDGLAAGQCSPWLDKDQLLAGQNWPRAVERAIDTADAFVACFSSRSVAKRGQFQSELRYALDCARRRPLDAAFLVPVRLESCSVPRQIADQVQYVDLFPDWEAGMKRLLCALTRAAPRARPILSSS
jgi:hypothetical protein